MLSLTDDGTNRVPLVTMGSCVQSNASRGSSGHANREPHLAPSCVDHCPLPDTPGHACRSVGRLYPLGKTPRPPLPRGAADHFTLLLLSYLPGIKWMDREGCFRLAACQIPFARQGHVVTYSGLSPMEPERVRVGKRFFPQD